MPKYVYNKIQPKGGRFWMYVSLILALLSCFLAWVAVKNSAPLNCDSVAFNEARQVRECILDLEPAKSVQLKGICLTEGLSPINTICIREQEPIVQEETPIEKVEEVMVNNDAPGVEPAQTEPVEEKPRFQPPARPTVNRREGTVGFGGEDGTN